MNTKSKHLPIFLVVILTILFGCGRKGNLGELKPTDENGISRDGSEAVPILHELFQYYVSITQDGSTLFTVSGEEETQARRDFHTVSFPGMEDEIYYHLTDEYDSFRPDVLSANGSKLLGRLYWYEGEDLYSGFYAFDTQSYEFAVITRGYSVDPTIDREGVYIAYKGEGVLWDESITLARIDGGVQSREIHRAPIISGALAISGDGSIVSIVVKSGLFDPPKSRVVSHDGLAVFEISDQLGFASSAAITLPGAR